MFFTQKDLVPEDIVLLDTHFALYVWMGKLSNREDQRLSIKTAIQYLQAGREIFNKLLLFQMLVKYFFSRPDR